MNILAVNEESREIRFPQPEPAQEEIISAGTCMDIVPAVIKVVGAGGGGSNAVNRMKESNVGGVGFIAVNTDLQDLSSKSKAETRLQIGVRTTGGMGAGGKPEIGEKAANEDRDEIASVLRGADMVFITAGMGGGTGTGSAPVIAKIAKEQGALTVAVVTKPFDFEGRYKMKLAEEGIKKLRESVDSLIVIPNQHLFKIVERSTGFEQACLLADDILRQGVQAIADIITKTGIINIDFADVKSIMEGQGDALMGIGVGSGENRAKEAAANAIDNPMLEDTCITGSTHVLVNITVPEVYSLVEIDEAMNTIRSKVDQDAEIIYGVMKDSSLGANIQITVIATGFKVPAKQPVLIHEIGKKQEGEVIKVTEFQEMQEQTSKQKQRPGYLSHRNYSEDLDIPTFIREKNYGFENTGYNQKNTGTANT